MSTAPSSNGQDARFSTSKSEFDSPWGHHYKPQCLIGKGSHKNRHHFVKVSAEGNCRINYEKVPEAAASPMSSAVIPKISARTSNVCSPIIGPGPRK